MTCPHGHSGRCTVCRMEDLVDYYGVVTDEKIDAVQEVEEDE